MNLPRRRYERVRNSILLLASLCAALVVVSCVTPDPPDWKLALSNPSPTPSYNPLPTSNQIVVYVDTSASMAGYVSKGHQEQTVFGRTLQELRNLATILTPPLDVFVRHVDTSVGPVLNDTELTKASIDPSLFKGSETDLAGAIGLFPAPLLKPEKRTDKESDGEESPAAAPPRFQILVTDGVQSTKDQRPDIACASGSDQVCVRKKILDLINKGWGGCILGMRSEFNGKVYSEINHSVITYRTKRHDLKTYRPFYLYVFSPDRSALPHLVRVLRERLRPLVEAEEGLRELSLTAPYADGHTQASAMVPKDQQDALKLSNPVQQKPARLTLRIDLNTEKTGPRQFSMTLGVPWTDDAVYMGSAKERSDLLHWELVPLYPGNSPAQGAKNVGRIRLPEVSILEQQADDQGRITLKFNASWPKGTGQVGWRIYHLTGRLNLEKQTPSWVQQWSTNLDTTEDACNKTLNLESVLLGLWRNDFAKDLIVAEAYIRVGPQ